MKNIHLYKAPNGDQLSYRLYGDAQGFPILVHHGLLGSSILPEAWGEKARELKIRLVAIDRPGYGESSETSKLENIYDWGSVIAPLLDTLGIGEFGSIAVSAGAPYAWSEAWHFKERVKELWLLSAVPNVFDDEILNCYPEEERNGYEKFKKSSIEQIAQDYCNSLNELQKQYKNSEGVSRRINAALSNKCIGVAREAKMQVSDWGFDVRKVTVPMEFWHSPKDEMVPIKAVEKMISDLPNAKLHLQAKKSHFPSAETVEEVFESIKNKISNY